MSPTQRGEEWRIPKTRGFWFVFESIDRMRFERMQGYVILPVHTQMAAAISGFYFGGGLAK